MNEVQNYSRQELQFRELNYRVHALLAKWAIKDSQFCVKQLDKTQEELNELRDEVVLRHFDDNWDKVRGELGDVLFCVLGVAAQLNIDPLEVLEETCTKNEKRKGKTVQGNFVKESDL